MASVIAVVGNELSKNDVVSVESKMLMPSSCVIFPETGPPVVNSILKSDVRLNTAELSSVCDNVVALAQPVPTQPVMLPPPKPTNTSRKLFGSNACQSTLPV